MADPTAPSPSDDLTLLSAQIQSHITALQSLLHAHSLPQPSLSLDLNPPPPTPLSLSQHASITPARHALAQSARTLYLLALGPHQWLHTHVLIDKYDTAVLRAILVFELDKAVPITAPEHATTTFADVAKAAKGGPLDERNVQRLLKFAMTIDVFCEPSPGVVAHTPLSAIWLRDPGARAWALHNIRDVWPSTVSFNDALVQYRGEEETDKTPRNLFYREGGSVFDYFKGGEERMSAFHGAMEASAQHPGFAVGPVAEWEGWGRLGEGAKVVDVSISYFDGR